MKNTLMANQPIDPDDESLAASNAGPSFADILSEYEQGPSKPGEEGAEGRDGVAVAISPEFVFVAVGLKTEGVIDAAAFGAEIPKRAEPLTVSSPDRHPQASST